MKKWISLNRNFKIIFHQGTTTTNHKTPSIPEADRFWNKPTNHNNTANEKYKTFCFEENKDRSLCDRDRFVEKFFKKYIGKYIAVIDKVFTGTISKYGNNSYYYLVKPVSIHSTDHDDTNINHPGEPPTNPKKNHHRIQHARNHNMMYGSGYIEISAMDVMGNTVSWKCNRNFISNFQFRFTTEQEPNHTANPPKDDRDPTPPTGKRIPGPKETAEKKPRRKNRAAKKTPTVYEDVETLAVDRDDAYNKFKEKHDFYVHSYDIKE